MRPINSANVAGRMLHRLISVISPLPDEADVLLGEAGSLPAGTLPHPLPPEGAGRGVASWYGPERAEMIARYIGENEGTVD
jgi:hypothetical protein